MSPGQQTALTQLELISSADPHALEILQVTPPAPPDTSCVVSFSLFIGDIERKPSGLKLRDREEFLLLIPKDFPLSQPSVYTPHTRFAGTSHVQWKHSICLYQSSTEYNPSDGIFGFLDRLWLWIRKGATDDLDPAGMPIHPPAVYTGKNGRLIIPTANTPEFEGVYWFGVCRLVDHTRYLEIASWHSPTDIPKGEKIAVAVLMGSPIAWEFPSNGGELFKELQDAGLPTESLYRLLELAALVTPPGEPLYFVLGTPMRGVSQGKAVQHLSIWNIDPDVRDDIALAIESPEHPQEIADISKKIRTLNQKILAASPVSWCPVIEARPETTIRRDEESPLKIFRDKSVALWGCGALGSYIATILCRAGIERIALWDKGIVNPGILVRQDFSHSDVGRSKVDALADRLHDINPSLQIDKHHEDIKRFLAGRNDGNHGFDFIIDATASTLVRLRVEIAWNDLLNRPPLATLMVDADANKAIAGVARATYSGGSFDLFRKAKMELLRRREFKPYADAFFPSEPPPPFQPEPGCSEPTFRGSAADSMALAAASLNLIARELTSESAEGSVHLISMPQAGTPRNLKFDFQPDIVCQTGSYTVRFSPPALKEMIATVRQNQRVRGRSKETGGLLWGEWDEAMKIVFVSDASGPPPDSGHSAELFVCGTIGTVEEAAERSKATRSSTNYLGMWHTHPVSSPTPSTTDIVGMTEVLTVHPSAPRTSLMVILGNHRGNDVLGVYLFQRHASKGGLQLLSYGSAWHPLGTKIL